MKKKIIISLILLGLNVFAKEVNIKGGFDFYRFYQKPFETIIKDNNALTISAEFIPFEYKFMEFGLGAEYSKTLGINKQITSLYTLTRFDLFNYNEKSFKIYNLHRLGGAYLTENKNYYFGLNYGIGLGFNYNVFSFDTIYNLYYAPNFTDKELHHSFGFRIGLNFSDSLFGNNDENISSDLQKEYEKVSANSNISTKLTNNKKDKLEENKTIKTQQIDNKINEKVDTKQFIISNFGFDKSNITNKMENEIKNIISEIKDGQNILVHGYTDSIGTKKYNKNLAYKRALNVAMSIIQNAKLKNIKINSINYIGIGKENFVDTNATSEGRAKNRRVEIIFK